jgi:hypothetical protein
MRWFSYSDFVAALAQFSGKPGTLECPSGCGILRPVNGPQFTLSWCPACHGVWFDHGEIAHMLAHYELREKPYPQVAAEQTAWSLLLSILVAFIP